MTRFRDASYPKDGFVEVIPTMPDRIEIEVAFRAEGDRRFGRLSAALSFADAERFARHILGCVTKARSAVDA